MKCWLFVLKQFIEDLKESIKASNSVRPDYPNYI